MKSGWKVWTAFPYTVALTTVVAWAGHRWLEGFDIRGPFLLMSPVIVGSFVFPAIFLLTRQIRCSVGSAKKQDVDLVQSVALEFGFGTVTLSKRQAHAKEQVFLTTDDGQEVNLPDGWEALAPGIKRFALVRALESNRMKWRLRYVRWIGGTIPQVACMIAAGLNLWFVLAIQAGYGLKVVVQTAVVHEHQVVREDIAALRKTRDLTAAIAFAKADPVNKTGVVDSNWRIARLRMAAARFGIA